MPTWSGEITVGANDGSGDLEGSYNNDIRIHSTSSSTDNRAVLLFDNVTVPRNNIIQSATLRIHTQNTNTAGSGTVQGRAYLASATNPSSAPSTASDIHAVATNSSYGTFQVVTGEAVSWKDIDVTAVVQEQVSKNGWSSGQNLMFLLRAVPFSLSKGGRRIVFRAFEYGGTFRPKLEIVHDAPPPVSGSTTATLPAMTVTAEGEVGTGAITGEATAILPAFSAVAEGFVGTPPTVTGQATAQLERLSVDAYGDLPEPGTNTLFAVAEPSLDSHHLVTEDGRVHGFAANFDRTIGGIRNEVIGSKDDAWLAASGLTSRTPAPLEFRANLLDRDEPRYDGDLLELALPSAKELHLPDGMVFDLWNGQKVARPHDAAVDISLITRGANPRHLLLSGSLNAAFKTEDHTELLPIYAIDPAGGIVAPVSFSHAPHGMMCFGARVLERGVQPLASLGRPVDENGQFEPRSVAFSYHERRLKLSLFGVESYVRENWLAEFGSVFVALVSWRGEHGHLTVASERGLYHYDVVAGSDKTLSERVLTAGMRADGVGLSGYMAPGCSSIRPAAPFFSFRVPSVREAEEAALKFFRRLNDPSFTWNVLPPEMSLELTREDTKLFEVAPSESQTFRFGVERIGGYNGTIEYAVTVPAEITATVTSAGSSGTRDLIDVTLSAPASTPEGAYAVRIEAKAQGADNPGSLLVNVRDTFDATLQVAAGPAIAPSPTVIMYAHDPVMQRASEIIRDSSANANTISWAGYARPNRLYTGFLCTGVFGAAVFSGALSNASQAHRMGGQQSAALILAEVNRTPVGGVVLQLAADNSENGVHILREQGGFKLRTRNGGTDVTSPDTLPWSSGYAYLMLNITDTDVILYDRMSGRSIRLARPAWPDAGVRFTFGALRNAAGAISSLARVHVMAATFHPYALSDLQRRRNIDALMPFAPASDGKGEFPNSAIGIFLWEDNDSNQPNRKLKNEAAPALGVTATTVGTVNTFSGGIFPQGSGAAVEIETGIPSSNIITAVTNIHDFRGSHTVEYQAQLGFADTSVATSTAMLARHANGQPFAMICNTDYNHTYSSVNYTPTSGDSLFSVRLRASARELTVTSLDNNTSRTVTANSNWNGNVVVSLGAVRRSNGNRDRRTPTRNKALVICRGDLTADEISTLRQLIR